MARAKKPIWDDDAPVAKFPRLEGDLDVDVAVVGGGITGVTAAYLLAKKNLRVVLIEKDAIGHGATGVTTAFLTQSLDTDPQDLEKMLGKKSAELAYQSHGEAIDTVEKIITKEGIDCEFMRCSNFFFASADDQSKEIDSLLAGATALGLPMKKATAALPFKHFGALDLSDQAKFHPLKYLYALAKKAEEYGAQIHEKTEAKSLSGEGPITIETARGTIHARYALLATYEPFTKPISLYFKKAFYTTYMLAGKVKKDFLPEATYEDLSNPYNYFRIDRGGKSDRIVFGGADHRSDVKVSPAKNFKAIEAFI
ncbi:MAG: FAD-binding oxidoreductase, partial [Candidatus Kaiserbacteria bacterium]|nr:FAD-binding oxidoreductase [Candidatus Kaiserbacteria bacterium]